MCLLPSDTLCDFGWSNATQRTAIANKSCKAPEGIQIFLWTPEQERSLEVPDILREKTGAGVSY